MNRSDDLERKLDQLLKEPKNPQLYNEIGVLLYQVKDLENAELYLKRAYALNPSNKDILYNYASLLYFQSKWQVAISIYQAYAAFDPDDKSVMEKVKNCYYQLGEYEKNVQLYKPRKIIKKGEA